MNKRAVLVLILSFFIGFNFLEVSCSGGETSSSDMPEREMFCESWHCLDIVFKDKKLCGGSRALLGIYVAHGLPLQSMPAVPPRNEVWRCPGDVSMATVSPLKIFHQLVVGLVSGRYKGQHIAPGGRVDLAVAKDWVWGIWWLYYMTKRKIHLILSTKTLKPVRQETFLISGEEEVNKPVGYGQTIMAVDFLMLLTALRMVFVERYPKVARFANQYTESSLWGGSLWSEETNIVRKIIADSFSYRDELSGVGAPKDRSFWCLREDLSFNDSSHAGRFEEAWNSLFKEVFQKILGLAGSTEYFYGLLPSLNSSRWGAEYHKQQVTICRQGRGRGTKDFEDESDEDDSSVESDSEVPSIWAQVENAACYKGWLEQIHKCSDSSKPPGDILAFPGKLLDLGKELDSLANLLLKEDDSIPSIPEEDRWSVLKQLVLLQKKLVAWAKSNQSAVASAEVSQLLRVQHMLEYDVPARIERWSVSEDIHWQRDVCELRRLLIELVKSDQELAYTLGDHHYLRTTPEYAAGVAMDTFPRQPDALNTQLLVKESLETIIAYKALLEMLAALGRCSLSIDNTMLAWEKLVKTAPPLVMKQMVQSTYLNQHMLHRNVRDCYGLAFEVRNFVSMAELHHFMIKWISECLSKENRDNGKQSAFICDLLPLVSNMQTFLTKALSLNRNVLSPQDYTRLTECLSGAFRFLLESHVSLMESTREADTELRTCVITRFDQQRKIFKEVFEVFHHSDLDVSSLAPVMERAEEWIWMSKAEESLIRKERDEWALEVALCAFQESAGRARSDGSKASEVACRRYKEQCSSMSVFEKVRKYSELPPSKVLIRLTVDLVNLIKPLERACIPNPEVQYFRRLLGRLLLLQNKLVAWVKSNHTVGYDEVASLFHVQFELERVFSYLRHWEKREHELQALEKVSLLRGLFSLRRQLIELVRRDQVLTDRLKEHDYLKQTPECMAEVLKLFISTLPGLSEVQELSKESIETLVAYGELMGKNLMLDKDGLRSFTNKELAKCWVEVLTLLIFWGNHLEQQEIYREWLVLHMLLISATYEIDISLSKSLAGEFGRQHKALQEAFEKFDLTFDFYGLADWMEKAKELLQNLYMEPSS